MKVAIRATVFADIAATIFRHHSIELTDSAHPHTHLQFVQVTLCPKWLLRNTQLHRKHRRCHITRSPATRVETSLCRARLSLNTASTRRSLRMPVLLIPSQSFAVLSSSSITTFNRARLMRPALFFDSHVSSMARTRVVVGVSVILVAALAISGTVFSETAMFRKWMLPA
jgi:hypothetical protein